MHMWIINYYGDFKKVKKEIILCRLSCGQFEVSFIDQNESNQ